MSVAEHVVSAVIEHGDEAWKLALKATGGVDPASGNPFLDKLMLSANTELQDPFNLQNNFKLKRDPKTGQMKYEVKSTGKIKSRTVDIPGLGKVKIPGSSFGVKTDKQGRVVVQFPFIGYNYRLGDAFDAQKALQGAKLFGRRLVKQNYSLIQDRIFPKTLQKELDAWIKTLPPEQRHALGQFARKLVQHGKNTVKTLVTDAAFGDEKAMKKVMGRELKALHNDLIRLGEQEGSMAAENLGDRILSMVVKSDQVKTKSRVRVRFDRKKEAWQVAAELTAKTVGTAVPTVDARVVTDNLTIQDPFNVGNNYPNTQPVLNMEEDTIEAALDEVQQASDGELNVEGREPGETVSFTMDG